MRACAPRTQEERPAPPPACGGVTQVSIESRSAGPLSTAEECSLRPGDTFRECVNCPEMVVVPAGSFTMGSADGENSRYEHPRHDVKIERPFAIGKFHVTVDQFAAFAADKKYDAGSKCSSWDGSKWVETEGRSWRSPGFARGEIRIRRCV